MCSPVDHSTSTRRRRRAFDIGRACRLCLLPALLLLPSLINSDENNFARPCLHNSSGALIDRNMFGALGRERCAMPIAPTLAQTQARELCHQIKFGGPSVTNLHGVEPD